MTHRNIVLVGYRGTGKTTVGRLLAAKLGWTFADADEAVEAAAGKTITDIFATEGEASFRDREAAALARSELGGGGEADLGVVFVSAAHGAAIRPASHFRPIWVGKAGDPVLAISSRYTDEEFAKAPVPGVFLAKRGCWWGQAE